MALVVSIISIQTTGIRKGFVGEEEPDGGPSRISSLREQPEQRSSVQWGDWPTGQGDGDEVDLMRKGG